LCGKLTNGKLQDAKVLIGKLDNGKVDNGKALIEKWRWLEKPHKNKKPGF
jgi:hypothetical protein